jgi:hypothetical protein
MPDGRTKPRQTRADRAEGYRVANIKCARIIASDPVKYPPGSLPAVWAAMILGSHRKEEETRRLTA